MNDRLVLLLSPASGERLHRGLLRNTQLPDAASRRSIHDLLVIVAHDAVLTRAVLVLG